MKKEKEGWNTIALSKRFGKTQKDTQVLGLPLMKLNEIFLFKDGSRKKLIHIEYRNMAVDLLRFDDRTEMFTEEIAEKIVFESGAKKL